MGSAVPIDRTIFRNTDGSKVKYLKLSMDMKAFKTSGSPVQATAVSKETLGVFQDSRAGAITRIKALEGIHKAQRYDSDLKQPRPEDSHTYNRAHRLERSTMSCPFHLAFPVRDVQEAREFYTEVLGCPEGRSAATWCDFNLFGHQIVAHRVEGYNAASSSNKVDGDAVPVPHFGAALSIEQFQQLAERLSSKGVQFIIEPHVRFQGQPGEQWTMFFKDPSGNSLEFKAMTHPDNLFAKYVVKE